MLTYFVCLWEKFTVCVRVHVLMCACVSVCLCVCMHKELLGKVGLRNTRRLVVYYSRDVEPISPYVI